MKLEVDPISLLETALGNLAFVAKAHDLEESQPFRMAMTQIDLALGMLRSSMIRTGDFQNPEIVGGQ